jgi:hypothetical protein
MELLRAGAQFEAVRTCMRSRSRAFKGSEIQRKSLYSPAGMTPIESNNIPGLLRVDSGDTEPSPNCFRHFCCLAQQELRLKLS